MMAGGSTGKSSVKLKDDQGNLVGVQFPLPTDGDSVYQKDLDIDNCTASGFTFDVGTSDLVDDVCAINDGDTVDYACINNGNNQTLMALYTIPNGKTGYLYQGTNSLIGLSRDYHVDGKMLMRPYGTVFQLKKTFSLDTEGTSFMVMPYPLQSKIPAKTDIRVQAKSSLAGGGINTTFEILLIDD